VSNIFISYRRSDSAPYAGRLFDRLTAHFSDPQVFMDLEIKPGDDFVERLEEGVGRCDVLLVLIGPDWLGAADAEGGRRLDDPQDFARIEVLAALNRGIRVIPVLVGRAVMPSARDLPADLAPLARRQALELSDLRFRTDTDRLIEVIEEELKARAGLAEEAERERAARDQQERLAAEAASADAAQREQDRVAAGEAAAQREKEHSTAAAEHERRAPAVAQSATADGQAPRRANAGSQRGPFASMTPARRRGAVVGVVCVLVALVIGVLAVSSGDESGDEAVGADPVVRVVGSSPSWRFEPNELTVPHNTSFTVVNETEDIISLRTYGLQGCVSGFCPAVDPGQQQSLTVAKLSGGSVSFPGRGPSDSLLVETR
jgi:TIR domain